MPQKKFKGKKVSLEDFVGEYAPRTRGPTLQSGPRARSQQDTFSNLEGRASKSSGWGRDRDDRSGGRDRNERPESQADSSDRWRSSGRGGNSSSSSSRSGFGQSGFNRGGDRDNNDRNSSSGFSTRRNQFDMDDNVDRRPAHLRRRAQLKGSSDVRGNLSSSRSASGMPAKLAARRAEAEAKKAAAEKKAKQDARNVVVSDEIANTTIKGKVQDLVSKLEKCIEDNKAIDNVAELTKGLKMLADDKKLVASSDWGATFSKSVTGESVTLTEIVNALDAEQAINATLQAELLAFGLQRLSKAKGEAFVRAAIDKQDLQESITTGLTGAGDKAEYKALLTKFNLLFLQAAGGALKADAIAALEAGKSPQELLDLINANVDSTVAVDFLVTPVSDKLFATLFANGNDLKVLTAYAPLVKRCVAKAPVSEKSFVIALQDAWFAAGADKQIIKDIVNAVFAQSIISFDGFQAWKDDFSIKSKGKLPMLLKISGILTDNEPKIIYEDSEEDEDDEEEEEGMMSL